MRMDNGSKKSPETLNSPTDSLPTSERTPKATAPASPSKKPLKPETYAGLLRAFRKTAMPTDPPANPPNQPNPPKRNRKKNYPKPKRRQPAGFSPRMKSRSVKTKS